MTDFIFSKDKNMNIKIEAAKIGDTNDLIDVQNKAFYSDYMKYGYCPGYNRTYRSMKNSIENATVFKIIADESTIGDIIVKSKGSGHYHLGGLCVIPEYQNRGIGQTAMRFLLSFFSDAKHWSLETPSDKGVNHSFYKKFGFTITKEYMDCDVKIVLFERDVE